LLAIAEQENAAAPKESPRHFSAETFGEFIKTVRESQSMHLADVARDADVNRQGLHKLEQGLHLPSIRTIEAVCNQMGLDPLLAIGKRFGEASGRASGQCYVIEGRLTELSGALVTGDHWVLRRLVPRPLVPGPLAAGEMCITADVETTGSTSATSKERL